MPDAITLGRIAERLGVDVAELLREDGVSREEQAGAGSQAPAADEAWADGEGREVGQGQELDARTLEQRLDAIEGLELSEALKILKIEAVCAAFRADAHREAERAARIRAEAMREAERSATIRARAFERAEGAASDRARALEREADLSRQRSEVLPIEGADVGEPISDEDVAAHLPPPPAYRKAAEGGGGRGAPRGPG